MQDIQQYIFNESAAVYNCNICGDLQVRMTGEGEQPPEDGCYNPECPSNAGKEPAKGLKVEYVEYIQKETYTCSCCHKVLIDISGKFIALESGKLILCCSDCMQAQDRVEKKHEYCEDCVF